MLIEVEATSSDLVARALERITAYDVDLRAFTYVAAGASVPDGHGDLRGLPIAVKDVIDVEGMPTTASSKVLRGNVADEDATVVARLRTRGATIVGKTNLDEFAYGVFSPPTRNPWDLERIPGGSSGGSAAAVAAGMCVGALGTDTAGSIRIPSALCGVFGLKPRPVVDMTGVIPLAPSLDCCGPLARDPRLLAMLWEAMAGLRSTGLQQSFAVAVFDVDDLDVEPDVALRYSDFVASLQADDSCAVVVKPLPPLSRWERPGGIMLAWEAWEAHRERGWFPDRSHLYSPELRRNLEVASAMDASQVDAAREAMDDLRREFSGLMSKVDIAVMPTTPCLAPRRDEVTGDSRRAWIKRLTRFAGHLNFCPLAAVTIPLWGADDPMPWGVDAIARDEETAIDFAAEHAPASRPFADER